MKRKASFRNQTRVTCADSNHSAARTCFMAPVLALMDDAILIIDTDYQVIFLNKPAEQLIQKAYGIRIKSGDSIFLLYPEPCSDHLDVLLSRALKRESVTTSFMVPGTRIWLHKHFDLLLDSPGNPIGICIRIKELHAEKQPELPQHPEGCLQPTAINGFTLFEQFMDHAPLIAWITDEQARIRYMNAAFLKTFGLTKNHLGKSIFDLFPEHFAAEYYINHREVLMHGKALETIERAMLPNGSEQILKTFRFPVYLQGGPMVGSWANDLTEILQLQGQLIENVERYSLVNKATTDAIYDWQMEKNKVFRGKGFTSLFGLDEQPVCIKEMLQLVHPEDREKVKKAYVNALRDPEKEKWHLEYRFRCADGSYKYVADKGIIQRYAGIVIRVIGALQNITEQKKLHKKLIQQEKTNKKRLVRSIIEVQEKERRNLSVELHDNVNQMLASCKLMLEVACDGGENASLLIQRTSTSIGQIINEIRRISHDLNPSALQDMGLEEAVSEMIESINATGKIQVLFTSKVKEHTTALSEEDNIAVYRIIQEQINNILKHAKATKATIDLYKTEKQLHLTIEDNGIGMDVHKVKKGLGLRSIQNRVDYYQGKMNIVSKKGKGTKTKIVLNLSEL